MGGVRYLTPARPRQAAATAVEQARPRGCSRVVRSSARGWARGVRWHVELGRRYDPISHREPSQRLDRFHRVGRGVQRPLDERCRRNGRHGHREVSVELYCFDPDRREGKRQADLIDGL